MDPLRRLCAYVRVKFKGEQSSVAADTLIRNPLLYEHPDHYRFPRTSAKDRNDQVMSSFIPTGPLDNERDVLRRMVFRIDHASATPVSTLMIEGLSQMEVERFRQNWHVADKELKETATQLGENFKMRISCEHTEQYKLVSTTFADLCEIVETYRHKHAERLRDTGIVDVHIEYVKGGYAPSRYRDESTYITKNGGKIYHTWPRYSPPKSKKATQIPDTGSMMSVPAKLCPLCGDWPEYIGQNGPPISMGLCALMAPGVKAKLYPADRDDVVVTHNTLPAELGERPPNDIDVSPRLQAGVMFPYDEPILSKTPLHQLHSERQREIRNEIDSICTNRPGSKSVEAFDNPRRATHEWSIFNSKYHRKSFQPVWYPDGQPFTKDPPGASNHTWWQRDMPKHCEMINEWRTQMATERGLPAPDPYIFEALPDPTIPLGEGLGWEGRLEISKADLTDKLEESARLEHCVKGVSANDSRDGNCVTGAMGAHAGRRDSAFAPLSSEERKRIRAITLAMYRGSPLDRRTAGVQQAAYSHSPQPAVSFEEATGQMSLPRSIRFARSDHSSSKGSDDSISSPERQTLSAPPIGSLPINIPRPSLLLSDLLVNDDSSVAVGSGRALSMDGFHDPPATDEHDALTGDDHGDLAPSDDHIDCAGFGRRTSPPSMDATDQGHIVASQRNIAMADTPRPTTRFPRQDVPIRGILRRPSGPTYPAANGTPRPGADAPHQYVAGPGFLRRPAVSSDLPLADASAAFTGQNGYDSSFDRRVHLQLEQHHQSAVRLREQSGYADPPAVRAASYTPNVARIAPDREKYTREGRLRDPPGSGPFPHPSGSLLTGQFQHEAFHHRRVTSPDTPSTSHTAGMPATPSTGLDDGSQRTPTKHVHFAQNPSNDRESPLNNVFLLDDQRERFDAPSVGEAPGKCGEQGRVNNANAGTAARDTGAPPGRAKVVGAARQVLKDLLEEDRSNKKKNTRSKR